MDFGEYLDTLTRQVGKYGRENCSPCDDLKTKTIGFRSPEGEVRLTSRAVIDYFADGYWMKHPLLVGIYHKQRGASPARRLTSIEIVWLLAKGIHAAIEDGELLYKAQHDPKRAKA